LQYVRVPQARKNQAAFSPLLRVLVKGGFDPNYQVRGQ
jgi:hypothetical protein